MADAVMCSYEGCSNNPVTTLQVDGEEKPACKGHLQTMVDQAKQQEDEEETDGTNYPVASNNEDQAAWINTTEDGKAYLSIKVQDGDYINLFPQSDALQITLNQIHEAQKQQ
jgi:uncharacterized protein (DUF736 family)